MTSFDDLDNNEDASIKYTQKNEPLKLTHGRASDSAWVVMTHGEKPLCVNSNFTFSVEFACCVVIFVRASWWHTIELYALSWRLPCIHTRYELYCLWLIISSMWLWCSCEFDEISCLLECTIHDLYSLIYPVAYRSWFRVVIRAVAWTSDIVCECCVIVKWCR